MKRLLTLLLCTLFITVTAQTNVRAWYAQGQVWIVWQGQQPFPQTFVVYKSSTAFTNVNQASPIGRIFNYEYLPGTFIEQTSNPNFKYKIPKPDGSTYTLQLGECLFVETVTVSGNAFYGVVEWGNTVVTADNITSSPIAYTYDPVNQPVNCHLQLTTTLPSGHKTNWYCLWTLGKLDHWAGRPDFPVMANVFKNGMPAMFIVSEAIGMDTTGGKKIPVTNWFHGGGGKAVQHIANKSSQFNIAPQIGISVSHNDDMPHLLISEGDTLLSSARTAWFGWSKNHNPFNAAYRANDNDTIINYTQRRILWINNWLIKNYNVDARRIALQGYSMGSAGASALGKLFPNFFSTVCAFNNGFRRVNEETITQIQGTVEQNLPTNLRNGKNETIHINEVMDMNTPLSAMRDLPLFRTWAGKNDINSRMYWGQDLIAQYQKADSLGWGMQISWDERPHTYETLNYHWIQDIAADQQTYRDNLSFQENFRNDQSFPAFFNHRLDAKNNNPGLGSIGINKGDGDNWGTWGGYHNWDLNNIIDESAEWSVTAWLQSNAVFTNDNCPNHSLTADLAIRKPQKFKPAQGTVLNWNVKDETTGIILQSGTTTVRADALVILPKIVVYQENIRKVRISVINSTVATASEPVFSNSTLTIEPNPSFNNSILTVFFKIPTTATIRAIGLNGKATAFTTQLLEGENRILLSHFDELPSGFYVVEVIAEGQRKSVKWVKL
ncbi:MAG: T9SS type A sorting domain-containing protein [Saprospiraceae bacterium]